MHRVSFGQDGRVQGSYALVLKRGASEKNADDLSALDGRLPGLLESMPIAVAVLGRNGELRRWNAAFARLMPEALQSAAGAAGPIYSGTLTSEQTPVGAPLC